VAPAAVEDALVALVAETRPAVVIVTGDLSNRGREDEFRAARALLDRLSAPWLAVPGNHDLPHSFPARFTAPGRLFEREIGPRNPTFHGEAITVQGFDSTRPWRHQGGRLRSEAAALAASTFASAPAGSLRVAALHHHLAGAPWRASRKFPLRRRSGRLQELRAAGAELVLGGHIHQSTIVRTTDVEAATDPERAPALMVTAPGLGRPRPHRTGEAQGIQLIEWSAEEIAIITLLWVARSDEGGRFAPAGRRSFAR
jgi:3',5'-cyclic AMP phosphodiesterase CpdA